MRFGDRKSENLAWNIVPGKVVHQRARKGERDATDRCLSVLEHFMSPGEDSENRTFYQLSIHYYTRLCEEEKKDISQLWKHFLLQLNFNLIPSKSELGDLGENHSPSEEFHI